LTDNYLCDVYIADCSDNGGVYCYSLTDTGTLTEKSFLPLSNPMFLNIEGNKMHIILRSVEEFNGDSATVTYDIADHGQLANPTELVSTCGKIACHISSLNGNVYTANYISGSICHQGGKVVEHFGYGPFVERQDKPHCHFISPSPDNKYLLAVDLGNDTIYTYDQNLNEIAIAKVPSGHGCRHLEYSDDGKYIYCINELASTVSVFEYSDGVLTLCDTYDTLPHFDGANTAAAIRVCGDYLYVSNRGQDKIVVFKIIGSELKFVSNFDCGGNSPRDFDIYNNILVCTNESGELSVFKVDGANSTAIECNIKLNHPLCVVFK